MDVVRGRGPFECLDFPASVNGNGGRFDAVDIRGGGGNETMSSAEEMSATMVAVPLNRHSPPPLPASGASELAISFEGEVHVFPSVTPEKVQAVLLLLGNRETTNTIPSYEYFLQLNDKAVDDVICGPNASQRAASLERFREKRKERCFEKKMRYACRNEVAQRGGLGGPLEDWQFESPGGLIRLVLLFDDASEKGQFASAKSICKTSDDNLGSGYSTPPPEPVLRRCHHCGASESSTPAMRRGPAGQRTLCNACGLMWANKGTLRDLTKGGRHSFDQNTREILEIKHVATEPDISYLNQYGERTADQTQTALVESGNPLTRKKQDLVEITDGITDDSSIGMDNSSGKLVYQETMDELANASGSEFEILPSFVEQVSSGQGHETMVAVWSGTKMMVAADRQCIKPAFC